MVRYRLLLLSLLTSLLLLVGCTGRPQPAEDDDDTLADDDDSSGDDDDSAGDDDDTTVDDDDSGGDDDDVTDDDDDITDDDDDTTEPPPPVIVGLWEDFWTEFAITESTWLSWDSNGTNRLSITSLDSAGGWLVAQNHPTSVSNPGLWTRIEWTDFGSQLVPFCVVVGDAATEAAALAAGPADVTDEWGGCNGASWDDLDPDSHVFAASGVYLDPSGTDVQITSGAWVETGSAGTFTYSMTMYGITDPYAVMQNGADNPSYPSLHSRWDVTWPGGDLYTCHTVADGADQAAAELATPADATDPATGGCNGGPWRLLTPQ
jgi:hypothetical protein